ncbi:MAG: alpha/beta hydrolase [Acetobacteraceae bacterium]|nr:alpha/beta hydrolase [Acetobacteraceae bacterium]
MIDLRPLIAQPGRNDLDVELPALPGRRIILRCARPRHFTFATPILFVHHGVNRNGADYRDYWLPLVDEADLLVIAPEFPNEGFPRAPWYNFGNRATAAGREKPQAEWTYGLDKFVFDAMRDQDLTRRRTYGVWGHSAGGQFVHRMIELGLRDNVRIAITANAGTYAMPTLDVAYPFGLGGTGLDEAALRRLLGFRLTVMAGTADIDTTSEHFPRDKAAMAQGPTRYARAHNFIATARAEAARLGITCAWNIIDVADVGHDGQRMAQAATRILSATLHI